MSATPTTWRERLMTWLQKHPPHLPPDDPRRALRDAFVSRFPQEHLRTLTKPQYALGHEHFRESFCYWLEWKTRTLGSVSGGSVTKWGLWWDKDSGDWKHNRVFKDADDALAKLTGGLADLIETVAAGRFDELERLDRALDPIMGYALRLKPLYLYFPEEFFPIASAAHLRRFCSLVGLTPVGGVLTMNRQLLEFFRAQPESRAMDPQQLMYFLYDPAATDALPPSEIEGDLDPVMQQLLALTRVPTTRNLILYGPPGTGKTWVVNHFANYFLLTHNGSPHQAEAYWKAVQQNDLSTQQQLQRAIRAEAEGEAERPNCWMLVAHEQARNWQWQQLYAEGEAFFSLGNIQRNFTAITPGDIIFGYRARPHSELIALARVREGVHSRITHGMAQQGISIEPIGPRPLTTPVKLKELASHPLLKYAEPLKMNLRGTLFKLTPEEGEVVTRLVQAAGNDVTLPEVVPQRNYFEFVTFHQSFAYEEFVEGIKPFTDLEGKIAYRVEPGVFRRICQRAEADPTQRYLLVIDEMNRANMAKVLGELITLLEDDKRLNTTNALRVTLPYSQERFGVPANLYLLGTMNTADRSIALLDLALRRRFTFLELLPDPALITGTPGGLDLSAVLRCLNDRIMALLDRDHQIGHSYLYGVTDMAALRFAWYHRIIPLLREYFSHDGERLRAVLGSAFIEPPVRSPRLFERDADVIDLERAEIVVRTFVGDDQGLIAAFQHMISGQTGDEPRD